MTIMTEETMAQAVTDVAEGQPPPEVKPDAAADAVADPPAEPPPEPTPADRLNESMERLRSQARDARQKQESLSAKQDEVDLAQRIMEAKKYGPDAVLKAAGVEVSVPDLGLDDLFPDEDKKADKKTPAVAELERKIAALEARDKDREAAMETERRQKQQVEFETWRNQQMTSIDQHLENNGDAYPYLQATSKLGSSNDVYKLMVQMHNQGYQPTLEQASEVMENYAKAFVDAIVKTEHFREAYGSQATTDGAKTLTSKMGGEGSIPVNDWEMTDAQNFEMSMAAAKHAAADAAAEKKSLQEKLAKELEK